MTTSVEAGSAQGRRHGWRPRCEPGLFDDLKCKAEGRNQRAEYDAEHAEELDAARASFEVARAAYTRVRATAEPLVEKAWTDYHGLLEKVTCGLSEEDSHRVELAYGRVARRLSECGGTDGCCANADCDYDEVGQCPLEEIAARIENIEQRTAEATACFRSLITETEDPAAPSPETTGTSVTVTVISAAARPTRTATAAPAAAPSASEPAAPEQPPTTKGLLARVAEIEAELKQIAERAKGEDWEATRLYAELLVARGHMESVWHGFANVNAYVDCMCQALTCMVKGHAAIGLLKGRVAVNDCYRRTWEADCARLREHTADEVMAEFIRVCEDDRVANEEHRDTPREPADRHDQDDGTPGRSRFEDHPAEPSAPSEPAPGDGTEEWHGGRETERPRYRDDRGRYRAP